MDANIPVETLQYVCEQCEHETIPVWYNPTDYRKCDKIVQTGCLSKLAYMSPNYKELLLIYKSAVNNDLTLSPSEKARLLDLVADHEQKPEKNMVHLEKILKYLLEFVPLIVVSRGEEDLILASRKALDLNSSDEMPIKGKTFWNEGHLKSHLYLFPTVKFDRDEITNVSGAGDSASSGIIAGIVKGYTLVESIYLGLLAANHTLKTNRTVSNELAKIKKSEVDKTVRENANNIKTIVLN